MVVGFKNIRIWQGSTKSIWHATSPLTTFNRKNGEEHDNPNPVDFDHDVINVELKRFEEKNPDVPPIFSSTVNQESIRHKSSH